MKKKLASWTMAHFAVDMSCFYILYRGVETLYHTNEAGTMMLSVAIMLYNCIAFGLQMVFGSLADKHPRIEQVIGAIGLECMLFPLTVIWVSKNAIASWGSLIICALLNAAFHVGGGMDVLKRSNGKVAPSGIFVSSGAIGVLFGTLYGKTGNGALFPMVVVVTASIFLFLSEKMCSTISISTPNKYEPPVSLAKFGVEIISVCLFAAIFIRSYAGIIWPNGFEKTGLLVLLPAVSSCLGKAFGGIVADKVGALETAVVSITMSIVLLFLSNDSWVIMGISIMLFNMAMPITLCGLATAMPNHLGFAFGLSTFALLLGYIAYAFGITTSNPYYIITILGITAIALMVLSLRKKQKNRSICGKKLMIS